MNFSSKYVKLRLYYWYHLKINVYLNQLSLPKLLNNVSLSISFSYSLSLLLALCNREKKRHKQLRKEQRESLKCKAKLHLGLNRNKESKRGREKYIALSILSSVKEPEPGLFTGSQSQLKKL